MSDDTQRVIGEHDAHIDQLRKDVREMREAVARIEAKLQQTEGAWRMLLGVSAVSSALTAAAFEVWGMMKGGA